MAGREEGSRMSSYPLIGPERMPESAVCRHVADGARPAIYESAAGDLGLACCIGCAAEGRPLEFRPE
jgi:hypothetical protein